MPSGAHWTLSYNATIDGRILARDHAHRLLLDEFVQHVDLTRDRLGSITLGVQFYDDRGSPYDERLTREVEAYRVLPLDPDSEPNPLRSLDQVIHDSINSPILRREFGHPWANPIRRNIDYVSTARRSILVVDPPYDYGVHQPLDNAQFGDAVRSLASLRPFSREDLLTTEAQVEHMGRMIASGLQVPQELLNPPTHPTTTMADVPEWLRVGVWVKCKNLIAVVEEIEDSVLIRGPFVRIKFWRKLNGEGMPLRIFIKNWVQCEKPPDPLSRYERILKGI